MTASAHAHNPLRQKRGKRKIRKVIHVLPEGQTERDCLAMDAIQAAVQSDQFLVNINSGCAMGDEVQDARAHGGPVRHGVDPPRAGARDGFDLTFGGILEWVVAQCVGSELGFGLEVLIEDEARDDAGLVDEPLLARDAASVGSGDAHRHPHTPSGRDTPR